MNILSTLLESASLTAAGADVAVHPWIDASSLVLGGGFDTLRYEPCASAVTPVKEPEVPTQTGQKVSYELTLIEDEYHYRKSLSITASASFKGWGGKASARMQMYESLNIDSYNVFLVARVSVVNATQILGDVELREKARREWLDEPQGNKRRNFTRVYGDTFLSAVTSGGELFVAFEFAATTREERKTLIVNLSASVGKFSSSVDIEKAITEISKHTTTKIFLIRDGGEGNLPNPTLAEALEVVRTFPTAVKDHPVPIFFETQRYSRVPDDSHIELEATDAVRRIEDMARAHDDLMQRRRDLRVVARHPNLFDVNAQKLGDELDLVEGSLLALERGAEDVALHRYQELPEANYPTIKDFSDLPVAMHGKELPVLIQLVGELGGPGGMPTSENGHQGDWLGGDKVLTGFSLECPDLPDDQVRLEYMVHYSGTGDSGWFQEPMQTPHGYHEGIAIRLVGTEAHRYTVAYQVGRFTTHATYYGRDGTFAGVRGIYMRIAGMSVVVKLKDLPA